MQGVEVETEAIVVVLHPIIAPAFCVYLSYDSGCCRRYSRPESLELKEGSRGRGRGDVVVVVVLNECDEGPSLAQPS